MFSQPSALCTWHKSHHEFTASCPGDNKQGAAAQTQQAPVSGDFQYPQNPVPGTSCHWERAGAVPAPSRSLPPPQWGGTTLGARQQQTVLLKAPAVSCSGMHSHGDSVGMARGSCQPGSAQRLSHPPPWSQAGGRDLMPYRQTQRDKQLLQLSAAARETAFTASL